MVNNIAVALVVALSSGALGCNRDAVRDLLDVEGKPLDDAVERYGAPSSDDVRTIRSGEMLPEFYGGLYAPVLDTLSVGTTVDVRQVMWGRRVAWAVERGGEWIVVDAMEWDADVEF